MQEEFNNILNKRDLGEQAKNFQAKWFKLLPKKEKKILIESINFIEERKNQIK